MCCTSKSLLYIPQKKKRLFFLFEREARRAKIGLLSHANVIIFIQFRRLMEPAAACANYIWSVDIN